jgi:hypothetical protein
MDRRSHTASLVVLGTTFLYGKKSFLKLLFEQVVGGVCKWQRRWPCGTETTTYLAQKSGANDAFPPTAPVLEPIADRPPSNLALRRDALTEAGCAKIFTEQMSDAVTDRPALHDALEFAHSGDTLIVWKLDRLARLMKQLIDGIMHKVQIRPYLIGRKPMGKRHVDPQPSLRPDPGSSPRNH